MVKSDNPKIAIIGAGHMGLSIASGFLNSKAFKKNQIILANPSDPDENWGLMWTTDNNFAAREAELVFLTVKPSSVEDVLKNINKQKTKKLLISAVAGVSLYKLNQLCADKNITGVRIMPSLGVRTQSGVIGVYTGSSKIRKLILLKEKLSLLGKIVEVPNEKELDILTIISGCAPALVAYFAQSFSEFSDLRDELVAESLLGSLIYIQQSGLSFKEIQEVVATKGGVTEKILNYLKSKETDKIIKLALRSGYDKLHDMN
jgi:pyrroline-5-carboxylate reductase